MMTPVIGFVYRWFDSKEELMSDSRNLFKTKLFIPHLN